MKFWLDLNRPQFDSTQADLTENWSPILTLTYKNAFLKLPSEILFYTGDWYLLDMRIVRRNKALFPFWRAQEERGTEFFLNNGCPFVRKIPFASCVGKKKKGLVRTHY